VQSLVYDKALYLIIRERAKLHKAEDEATLEWPCQCTTKASIGIPCFHDLFYCLKDGGQVLLKDIHPFWWYDRTKVNTTLGGQGLPAIVLDPAIVKGKGRSKGSLGKRKGAGPAGMSTIFKLPYITVLILDFLIV
jgi:hypothetical protein